MKLGIVVPYRDRYEHLQTFKKSVIKYFESTKIDYELIVVEQDDAKVFNRGKLLNIGFKYAKKLKCDYVAFHDVDMLPVDVDYSYSNVPIHLASRFVSTSDFKRIVFDEYFGGVTLFPVDVFEKINGYSNEYWGWGYEDNDLLHRCKHYNIDLDKKEIKTMGGNTAALKFNGKNAYVTGKNPITTKEPITIFTTFYADELQCNHEAYDDILSVFSIPGYDCLISYNSYKRYNFEMYDSRKEVIYVNSNIKTNYKTNIAVTIDFDNRKVKMYQDGNLVGETTFSGRAYPYDKVDNFYLGVGDPNREENNKYFKGLISSFSIFSKLLDEDEIKEISNNQFFSLSQNFGNYKSSHALEVCYDAKFIKDYELIDLSGNNNNGVLNECEMVGYTFDDSKIIEIPFRRESTFKLLAHEENGYVGNGWKNITTRYNQLKYHNEVAKGYKDPKFDGLSNLEYKEHTYAHTNNQTHILVGI
jgi:hypothetical protein